jgi:hypothetical protein
MLCPSQPFDSEACASGSFGIVVTFCGCDAS